VNQLAYFWAKSAQCPFQSFASNCCLDHFKLTETPAGFDNEIWLTDGEPRTDSSLVKERVTIQNATFAAPICLLEPSSNDLQINCLFGKLSTSPNFNFMICKQALEEFRKLDLKSLITHLIGRADLEIVKQEDDLESIDFMFEILGNRVFILPTKDVFQLAKNS